MTVLVEAAVSTVERARRAVQDGAARIELCDSLDVGGITPDVEVLRAVRAAIGVPIHVLIRPRAGDFVYSPAELDAMLAAVRQARDAGADAVVIGALTREGRIDRAVLGELTAAAGTLSVVAHRAVDVARNVEEAVEEIAALGVGRVLTSGGAQTAEEGAATLARLVRRHQGQIAILAGGGIRAVNVCGIVEASGATEVHVGFPETAEADRVHALTAALATRRVRRMRVKTSGT